MGNTLKAVFSSIQLNYPLFLNYLKIFPILVSLLSNSMNLKNSHTSI